MNKKEHYKTFVYPTAFHSRTSKLNQMQESHRWKDYLVADVYEDVALEYFAMRNSTGVFDLCPMTKHKITGPDALEFLNRMLTRDVSKLKPGRVSYCVWCDDEGQVIDDACAWGGHRSFEVYVKHGLRATSVEPRPGKPKLRSVPHGQAE